jgi:hypothetical protein
MSSDSVVRMAIDPDANARVRLSLFHPGKHVWKICC